MIDNEKDRLVSEAIEKHRAELRIVSDRVSQSYCVVLKKGREKKGLSVADLSRELKVPSYIITALEEQQYEKLPSDTYVIGYIRAYSDLLGLNPEGLIKDYRQDKAFRMRGEQERVFKEENERQLIEAEKEPYIEKSVKQVLRNLAHVRTQYGLKVTVAGILIVLCVYVLVEYFENEPVKNIAEENQMIESVKVQNADGSIVVTDIMDEAQHTPVVASDSVIPEDSLKFIFSGTSWVTVRDENGNLLHQSREQKGAVLELAGHAPFFVRLSNASAVSLLFNGKSHDFSAFVADDGQLFEQRIPPQE